ncbi:MAG: sugar transferase [Hyphomonadaceae bacterium]|nr:sugar transferase [Hyphomonadaceae bacterium]
MSRAAEHLVAESTTAWAEPAADAIVREPAPIAVHPVYAGRALKPVGGLAKRAFDVCFAAAALTLLAPLLAVIALAIRLDSRGPAIFRQERGGFNGRRFRIWKFRTMRDEPYDTRQVAHDDERVTRVGRWLRRMSLDEFPQLVNVLMGDMSLVGPRPHMIAHDREFTTVDPRYPLRTRARPGITGLAQVVGHRGPASTNEKIQNRTACDVAYVEGWSFQQDMQLVARTFVVLWNDARTL